MDKLPTYYVIQLNPPQKYIVINYSLNKPPEEILEKLRTKNFESAILREDLINKAPADAKDINGYCKTLSRRLAAKGFISISGGGLMNDYWQLYVIRLNSKGSKRLYVGSTQYPRETRFKQHVIGWKSANIFNRHTPHSLDNQLFDYTVQYFDKESAEAAEKQLAAKLRRRYFNVKQA